MPTKKSLDVVAALIRRGDKILIAQRYSDDAYGSLWEFPGGKIEAGETPVQALEREIIEELATEVKVGALVGSYADESADLKINVDLYDCLIVRGEPVAAECAQVCWISPDDLLTRELAPADKKAAGFVRDYLRKEKI